MTDERITTGYAALQTESTDVPTDGPYTVHGVAIGENDITVGGSGKETLWPREALEDAADGLEGQPLATDTNHTAENPKAQTPVEAIAGEVTWSGYKPGVGVLYEAEVDDESLAKKVNNGRLEVSPLVSRELEALKSDEAEYKATEITRWRDLALVANGAAPSNEIQVGDNPMKAEALADSIASLKDENVSSASNGDSGTEVSEEALKEVAGVSFESTGEGELDESDIPNDDFEDHYLYPGENKTESSYPVVDADGTLRMGNVEAAHQLGCRGKCPSDESHDEKLTALAMEFESPPEWAGDESMASGGEPENPAHWEACSLDVPVASTQSDDGTEAGSAPSSVADETEETMTDELTETEQAVLEAAESIEEPVEALEEYAATEQPTVVNGEQHESLQEDVSEVRTVLSEALSEKTELKDSTIEALSFEALCDEFRDEEGELQVEALRQVPESGEPEAEPEEGAEALSDDADVDKAEALYDDYTSMNRPPKGLEDDITEALGVSDFDEAKEVLD